MAAEKIKTSFENKCAILSKIWMEYRDDEDFEDFVAYNDLGLPMAYMIDNGIVEIEDGSIGGNFINETFRILLSAFAIEEDLGFEELEDVFSASEGDNGRSVYDESEEEEEDIDEPASEWDKGWDKGWDDGVKAEQDRIQGLCTFYTEMYLEEGKGQKAVLWREVADALKPLEVKEYNPEDDGF